MPARTARVVSCTSDEQDEEQAVLVTFPHAVGRKVGAPVDVTELTDAVGRAVEVAGTGVLDGAQTRAGSLTLFAYGRDADQLWRSMEPAVRAFPFRPAHVVIRYGWFGAPDRTVQL
jgi:hypothetical protein